jgi:hypothetical protein
MREIDHHKVPGKGGGYGGNTIWARDEPGQGGANHLYSVHEDGAAGPLCEVHFQNGPIQEVGVNGVQQEDLLAIVIDRLTAFQAGPFANEYNAKALAHTLVALSALQQRTIDRLARGVEGFNKA